MDFFLAAAYKRVTQVQPMMVILPMLLVWHHPLMTAQCWYLSVANGELICLAEGGERFVEQGLLAVGKGDERDLSEQLPHALDSYGLRYEYTEGGLRIYLAPVYQAWPI